LILGLASGCAGWADLGGSPPDAQIGDHGSNAPISEASPDAGAEGVGKGVGAVAVDASIPFDAGPTEPVCSTDGWCWSQPTLQGNGLRALSGVAPNDAWAVGNHGTILHFDGARWSAVESPTFVQLNGVWAAGPTDAWAVGEAGAMLHWDGTSWKSERGDTTSFTTLKAVWGTSPTNVLAVGTTYDFGMSQPTVSRWDGVKWTTVSIYAENGIGYGIWGSSPSDVWVCGDSGVWHYDGSKWTTAIGTGGDLNAIWGSGPNDVWAVGYYGRAIHWDGAAWTAIPSDAATNEIELDAVWGTGPNDVWASTNRGELMHWNGTAWSAPKSALVESTYQVPIQGMWGTSANDAWLVGEGGMMQHWDGAAWTDTAGSHRYLRGVWGSSATNVWAVGVQGVVRHWDGMSWLDMSQADQPYFNAVWGSGETDLWAVGFSNGTRHWDGKTWAEASDLLSSFYGMAGVSAKDVWAVGAGDMAHFDGASWTYTTVADGGTPTLASVWTASTDNAWAVSIGGAFHWNGSVWSLVDATVTANDVWGSGPNDIWAAGRQGNIWHWDGNSWTVSANFDQTVFWSVAGTRANDVWAVGTGGLIVHWDGASWTRSESGTLNSLDHVWGASTGEVWAVGSWGTILRHH
jgi:hypothetical protein